MTDWLSLHYTTWCFLQDPHIFPWMWCLNIFGKRLIEIIFLIPTMYGDQKFTRLSRWDHSSVQFSRSVVSDCDPMDYSMPGFPVHHQLPELAQTHVHWISDAIQPSHPLSPPFPPALSLSQHQGLFQWVSHIEWPKYWSFSFNISSSNKCSGLISFRIGWFDLLPVQGTLKSLLQHH